MFGLAIAENTAPHFAAQLLGNELMAVAYA